MPHFHNLGKLSCRFPQKLVIGVQEVPGEISYDYHYHTDAEGTHVGEVDIRMWRAAAIQRQFTIPIRTLAITGRMSITAIANPIRSGWTGLAATRIGELL